MKRRLSSECFSMHLKLWLLSFVLCFQAWSVMGQIAQRGTATSAISTSATVTINKPAGVVAGDVMIANVGSYCSGCTQTSASLSGWTLVASNNIERGRASLLYKIAGSSEPSSYTFSVTSGSTAATGAIVAFSGVNGTNPFDVAAPANWTTATSQTINNLPGISTVTNGAALLVFGASGRITSQTSSNFTSWTLTNPTLSELFDVGHNNSSNTVAVGCAWGIRNTAGATGNGGFTCTPNTNPRLMGGIMIALRPCSVNTVSAASSNPVLCVNTSLPSITHTTAGATGIGVATGLPAGVSATWSSNTITITGTPTASGTFNYNIPLTGGCGSANATGTITVNENTIVLTSGVGSQNQVTCLNSAISPIGYQTTGATGATFSGLPAGVSGSWSGNIVSITGTPSESGIFNYTVTMTGGCPGLTNSASGSITVESANALYEHSFDNLSNSNTNFTLSPLSTSPSGIFISGLSASSWSATSNGSAVGFTRINSNGGYALAFNPSSNVSSAITLQFNVNPQYVASISSFNFWRYRQNTSAPGISSITVNGTTIYGGESTPTTGSNLGTTCVSNPINNLTGLVTVVINLTPSSASQGNRWFYLDDFVLNGSISSSNPYQEVYLHNFNSSPNSSPYTISPTASTGLPVGIFNSNFTAGSSSWISSTGNLTNTSDGQGGLDLAVLTPPNAPSTLTLTFSIQCGYALNLDAIDFRQARQSSSSSNITSIIINGTQVYSGSTAPVVTFENIGVTALETALTEITGTVTVVIHLSASNETTGNRYFYLDDFTLFGTVVTSSSSSVSAGNASGTPTVCINNTMTQITHATSGATGIGAATGLPAGVTASWSSNTITISGTPSASGTFNYTIPLTGNCGVASASGTITVLTAVTPTVIIASNDADNSICAGTSVTFTAAPTNGGTTPSYQWKLNGANVGSNVATYTNAALANNDVVTVVMTANNTCQTSATANGNNITTTVINNVTPSVAVASNDADNSICAGTSVTFTATPTNGGTTPSYQWKLNGANVGSNVATYTNASLTNNAVVTVVMTSNNVCQTAATANGNNITTTVINNVTPSVAVASNDADNSICAGTSVTFTATPTNGGTTPSYQWKLNGANVGSNVATYTNASLTNNAVVTVVMTSNNVCQTVSTANGNNITTTVINNVTPSVAVSSNDADNSICAGTSVTFTATPTNGGTTPSYQWKLNGANVGSNVATYTNASLTNNAVVTVVMTSNNVCQTVSTANGNNITTTVINNVTPSVAVSSNDADNSICAGTSVTFTATPTNGGTTPSYQWKLNGANVGSNVATYTNASLTNNAVVTVVMTSNNVCQTVATANGNNMTTTVINNVTPAVSILANNTVICPGSGSVVTFTASPSNGGTAPAYQWKVNGANVGTNSTTFSSSTLSGGDNVKVDMLANNQCQTAAMASSSAVSISALPVYSYYQDNDGDGYGNPSTGVSDCTSPLGYVMDNTDCLDNNGDVYPDGAEICNGMDDNCDGNNDEGVELTTYYLDNDGDGFGGSIGSIQSCDIPAGYIQLGGDCNDNNANVRPTASELCSTNFDDDCDGLINEICFPGNDNPNFASNCPLSTSTTLCNTVTGNLQAATATASFGTSSLSMNPDVWFYFTANAVGMTIRCTPSLNDVGLELRTSSGELLKTMNALSAVGDEYMNYDDLTIGNQYYLRVMNMNASAQGGSFTLCARRIVPTTSAFNYTNVYVYNTGCNNVVPTNLSTFTNTSISLTPLGGVTEYTAQGPTAQLGEFLSATGNAVDYNTVYTGKVTFGSMYPIGGGNTEMLTFTSNMSNTLNVLPLVDLDLGSNYVCPRTWSIGTLIRADRWICGAVKYQWRFEQYLNGQPYLVNGNPVVIEQYGANGSRDLYTLAAYGFLPGSEWRVKVRPVFPNDVHGDYGSDEQCLKFKGAMAAAPLIDEGNDDFGSFESKITLYPNPSNNGEINLMNAQWSDAVVSMNLLDATGKIVLARVYSESAVIQENVSELSNGMYLIQLSWGNQSTQLHWILQR